MEQVVLRELRILAGEDEVSQSSVGCLSKSLGGCGHSSGSRLGMGLQTCRGLHRHPWAYPGWMWP